MARTWCQQYMYMKLYKTKQFRQNVPLISAGIHHLILDQNLRVLKKLLLPDDILSRMLNQENMEYVSSTDEQEEQIQRFTKCLQSCPLNDYRNFIELLYKTKQDLLITALVTSCKNLINFTFI